jgi:peroxiredoxin (alkyl hydroperoxide reductase subunit C)
MIEQTIPVFEATAYHQSKFVKVTNENAIGSWSIFFFYPRDFTFICPTELEDMNKHYQEFKKIDVEVFAVSTDSHFVHKAWHDSSPVIGKIQFPMLGDPTWRMTRDFGALSEVNGEALRATFLADPEGKIKVYEIHSDGIGRSARDFSRKVRAAQFVANNDGSVCPAAWEEGSPTLKPSIDLVGKI